MNEATDAPRLDYAPGAPIRRKRRIRRMAALCLGTALIVVGYRWGPTTWTRSVLLYHQRGCLRYSAPPEQVVFDSNPARVAFLAVDPHYVIKGGCAFRKAPADWLAIRPSAAPGTIFLHELKLGGVARLVELERTGGTGCSPYFINDYDVESHVLIPARFTKPTLDEGVLISDIDVLDSSSPHLDIRIYAGQIDPANPSHFTIRYENGGKVGHADGYLRERDSIVIEAHPGQ